MEPRKNRISVGGLRRADPVNLAVLTQDVLRLPLGQIERNTLLDLLALSEVPEQVPTQLGKDLQRFRDQMAREIDDLPDGPPLAEFARELSAIEPARAPMSLRQVVADLIPERSHGDAVAALKDLLGHWEGSEPTPVSLPRSAPDIAPSKTTGAGRPRREILKPAPRPSSSGSSTPTVDERREEWIREDVIARLTNYGSRGLKEPIVVAGARHRAPWKDLSESEILTTLRKMKREGRVRFSAGRWMMNT